MKGFVIAAIVAGGVILLGIIEFAIIAIIAAKKAQEQIDE